MPDQDETFFEDDEPVEDVIRAFNEGRPAVTSPPRQEYAFVAGASSNVGVASIEIPVMVSGPVMQWSAVAIENAGGVAAEA